MLHCWTEMAVKWPRRLWGHKQNLSHIQCGIRYIQNRNQMNFCFRMADLDMTWNLSSVKLKPSVLYRPFWAPLPPPQVWTRVPDVSHRPYRSDTPVSDPSHKTAWVSPDAPNTPASLDPQTLSLLLHKPLRSRPWGPAARSSVPSRQTPYSAALGWTGGPTWYRVACIPDTVSDGSFGNDCWYTVGRTCGHTAGSLDLWSPPNTPSTGSVSTAENPSQLGYLFEIRRLTKCCLCPLNVPNTHWQGGLDMSCCPSSCGDKWQHMSSTCAGAGACLGDLPLPLLD